MGRNQGISVVFVLICMLMLAACGSGATKFELENQPVTIGLKDFSRVQGGQDELLTIDVTERPDDVEIRVLINQDTETSFQVFECPLRFCSLSATLRQQNQSGDLTATRATARYVIFLV
ncbi:MAG: hypothetical protein R3F46_08800 [bacterium]